MTVGRWCVVRDSRPVSGLNLDVGLDVGELQRDLPCPKIVVAKPKTLALAMVELALRRAAPMADRRVVRPRIQ